MKKTPRKLAEEFINGQLKIIAKHGGSSKASKKLIAQSIGRAEKSFVALTSDSTDHLDLR